MSQVQSLGNIEQLHVTITLRNFSTLFHQACGQAAHQPRTKRPDSLQEMECNILQKNYFPSVTMTALLLAIINTSTCILFPELF